MFGYSSKNHDDYLKIHTIIMIFQNNYMLFQIHSDLITDFGYLSVTPNMLITFTYTMFLPINGNHDHNALGAIRET